MSKSSYILLADYAKSAGLSLEEARELVSREENKKFFKVANGKEMVSTAIGKKNPPATAEQAEETPAPQEKPAPAPAPAREGEAEPTSPATTADQEEIERLRKEVEALKEQVKSKDNQIAEYAFRFAELAQQAQIIAGQAQVLQAKEQKLLDEPTSQKPEQKQGFFRKLFGR